MSLLSFIATVVFCTYVFMLFTVINTVRPPYRIASVSLVLALAWWSFCSAFFYSAPTHTQAVIWHNLGEIGWCAIPVFGLFWTMCYVGRWEWFKKSWHTLVFFGPALVVIVLNLMGPATSFETHIVQSTSGLGWTYVNTLSNWKLWMFILYSIVYFTAMFVQFKKEAAAGSDSSTVLLSKAFIALEALVITLVIVSDCIMPLFTQWLPPLGSIATLIHAYCYMRFLVRYDKTNLEQFFPSGYIIEKSPNPLMILDPEGRLLTGNTAMKDMLSEYSAVLRTRGITEFIHREDTNGLSFSEYMKTHEKLELQGSIPNANGEPTHYVSRIARVETKEKVLKGYIVYAHDVSELIRVQEQLRIEAYRDALTGLYNRHAFFEATKIFSNRFDKKGKDYAIMMIDLNHFKEINDLYGHQEGDRALMQVAEILRSNVDAHDYVFRMGGDEFVILVNTTDKTICEQLIWRIKKDVRLFAREKYTRVALGAAFGIVNFSTFKNTDEALVAADENMYMDKHGDAR